MTAMFWRVACSVRLTSYRVSVIDFRVSHSQCLSLLVFITFVTYVATQYFLIITILGSRDSTTVFISYTVMMSTV